MSNEGQVCGSVLWVGKREAKRSSKKDCGKQGPELNRRECKRPRWRTAAIGEPCPGLAATFVLGRRTACTANKRLIQMTSEVTVKVYHHKTIKRERNKGNPHTASNC